MRNDIKISYPRSNNKNLNKIIKNKIKDIINEFMEYASIESIFQFPYTLYINYETYNYNDQVSYVFYISMYTGGAHPDNRITTINYDLKRNREIGIRKLYNNLENLSEISRYLLKQNRNLMQIPQILPMIEEGTTPIESNFKNFAITKDGVIIFFEPAQVAPYSSGTIKILIPNRY